MSNFHEIEGIFNQDLNVIERIGDIPWAFADAEAKKIEWSNKVQNYFSIEEQNLSYLQGLLTQKLIEDNRKTRIQKFIKDKHAHLKQMKKVLDPFLKNKEKAIVLDNQNILSYQDNIFRDWCWGQKENNIYADYILKNISPNAKNILVLGAGACGLSYDLAKQHKGNVIASDINPYLFLTANKIFSKKHLNLYEFIDYPKEDEPTSRKWEIKPIDDCQDNHFQVFCDFTQMPFKEKSFDVIIGCWFFDILDISLSNSLGHLNKYLKPKGQCLYIGPANFHKSKFEDKLTTKEIVETFYQFYENASNSTDQITYLDNPANSYKRQEDILFLTASNPTATINLPTESDQDFIQPTSKLMAYKQKTEVFHRILKHIERPITISALAREVQKEFGFTEDEAKFYTKSVIKKLQSEINQ